MPLLPEANVVDEGNIPSCCCGGTNPPAAPTASTPPPAPFAPAENGSVVSALAAGAATPGVISNGLETPPPPPAPTPLPESDGLGAITLPSLPAPTPLLEAKDGDSWREYSLWRPGPPRRPFANPAEGGDGAKGSPGPPGPPLDDIQDAKSVDEDCRCWVAPSTPWFRLVALDDVTETIEDDWFPGKPPGKEPDSGRGAGSSGAPGGISGAAALGAPPPNAAANGSLGASRTMVVEGEIRARGSGGGNRGGMGRYGSDGDHNSQHLLQARERRFSCGAPLKVRRHVSGSNAQGKLPMVTLVCIGIYPTRIHVFPLRTDIEHNLGAHALAYQLPPDDDTFGMREREDAE